MTDKVREVQNFLAEKGIISSEVAIVNAAIDIIQGMPEGYDTFVKKFKDSQREFEKEKFGKYVSLRTSIGYKSAADLYEYCKALGLTKEEVALKHGDPASLTLLIASKSIWERYNHDNPNSHTKRHI